MDDANPQTEEKPTVWKTPLLADLDRVAARDRWGLALIAVGWVHLASFSLCQKLHSSGDRNGFHYVPIWIIEVAAMLWILRKVAGRDWYRSTPMAGLIARIWGTFLILSFNLASLNTLSGLDHEWFKPVLCTLSTFGFATMAYLIHPRFFLPAVQMYLTGLLMVLNLDESYAIYGLSWWLALQGIGVSLERRRLRLAPPRDDRRLRPPLTYRPSMAGVDSPRS